MSRIFTTAIGLVVFLAGWSPAPAAEPRIAVTADTEGRAISSSGPSASAGLAQRAAVLAKVRKQPALLIDAGNFLFGADSAASDGKVIPAAYKALAYDAVNISYRDFRMGKAKTLDLLREASLPAISANLLHEQTNKPLLAPYIVCETAGQKIAIVGVTEVPAGYEAIPHLKQQLAGIVIQPPLEALAKWLPEAKGKADRVVIAYYGSVAGVAAAAEKFGGDSALIAVGGVRPEHLIPNDKVTLAAVSANADELAVVTLAAAGKKAVGFYVDIDPQGPADPAIGRLIASLAPTSRPALPATVPAAAVQPLGAPQAGKAYALELSTRNQAAKIKVTQLELLDEYSGVAAEAGHKLLVLQTEWENMIPQKLAEDRALATAYKIPNMADHLYVVVNGRQVGRLHPKAAGMGGHIAVGDFQINKVGDVVRGNVVFQVPAAGIESLDLRLYDFAMGNAALLLCGTRTAEDKPVVALQKNELVQAGVYAFAKMAECAGRKAPEGMTFVAVDLRALSFFMVKSATGMVGTVADWKDSRKYAQLVIDGEYAYAPLDSSALDPEPRFLPDIATGGQLVFLAPAQCKSIELRCDFPNAATPTGVIKPTGLTFLLEGKRPALDAQAAIVAIVDDNFRVSITGQKALADVAGQTAPQGKRFLVLESTVHNTAKGGDFFQPAEQLKLALANGNQVDFDPASASLAHPAPAALWIPGGERRSIEIAYCIDTKETKPRLSYRGVSMAKIYDLKPIVDEKPPVVEPPIVIDPPATKPVVIDPPVATKPVVIKPPVATKPVAVKPPRRGAKKDELPQRVAAKSDLTPKGIEGVGLTAEQVNTAIDKGAAWLWSEYQKRIARDKNDIIGRHREDLLWTLALVHAGGHRKYPEFDQALREFLAKGLLPQDMGGYEAGLYCMLVEGYGDPSFLPSLRKTARYLVEAQGPLGTWSYGVHLPEEIYSDPVDLSVLGVSGGMPLGGPATRPWTRVTKPQKEGDGDNSVSQYALLGLCSTSRASIPIDDSVWKLHLAEVRDRQNRDGGWGYHRDNSYGSMTSAGICALAICRHELGEKDVNADEGIEKGLGWLSAYFSVGQNPEHSNYAYYYLYSLERVGRILDTEFIGEHEWYPEGARFLVGAQQKDGGWPKADNEDRDLTTSFALLFLTRATPSLNVAAKRGGDGILKTGLALRPAMRLYFILDASGSMLEEMDGQQKFKLASGAVASIIKDLPDNTEVGLRVYGHRKTALDDGASEDTQLVIPLEKLEREKFLGTLNSLRARGKTPLALSLTEAQKDLGHGSAEQPITVVLLTDGGEDTFPRRDPLKAADEFAKLKNVNLHVVGFDINQADWSEQLQAIASRAHGRYYPAARGEVLFREMRSAVFGTPESFTVFDAAGKQVEQGRFGESKKLHEGKYALKTVFAGQSFEQSFWINTDSTTAVIFNAARVPFSPAAGTAKPPTADPTITQPPATAPAASKFCTHCGKPLKPGAKFCTECGGKVEP